MLSELLAGLVVALAYFPGYLLYTQTRDELDPLEKYFSWLRKVALTLAGVYGAILGLAFAFGYEMLAAVALFILIVAQSSVTAIKIKKRKALFLALQQAAILFVIFAIIQFGF